MERNRIIGDLVYVKNVKADIVLLSRILMYPYICSFYLKLYYTVVAPHVTRSRFLHNTICVQLISHLYQ